MTLTRGSVLRDRLLQLVLAPLVALVASFTYLAGIIGLRTISLIQIITTAYRLWRSGYGLRAAISAATGGWGFVINLLAQFGLAYLASQAERGGWIIGY